MASFDIEILKWGFENMPLSGCVTIKNITFDEGDSVVRLPDSFEGEPITHLAYVQDYTPEHEHFHDWHHPAQGSEFVPGKYTFTSRSIKIPSYVKRFIIPASIREIGYKGLIYTDETVIEVDENNMTYTVEGNKIVYKR